MCSGCNLWITSARNPSPVSKDRRNTILRSLLWCDLPSFLDFLHEKIHRLIHGSFLDNVLQ